MFSAVVPSGFHYARFDLPLRANLPPFLLINQNIVQVIGPAASLIVAEHT